MPHRGGRDMTIGICKNHINHIINNYITPFTSLIQFAYHMVVVKGEHIPAVERWGRFFESLNVTISILMLILDADIYELP